MRDCLLTLLLLSVPLAAQTAGTIATHGIPIFGTSLIDPAGNIYSIGSGPVTPGAAQTQPGGGTCYFATGYIGSIPGPCSDAYVGKVGASGNIVFGTLLGGSTADTATALAVDSAGAVYIAGSTGGGFPVTADSAITAGTSRSGFAAKLSADGSRILYATYLPATLAYPFSIAIDAQGNAYMTGQTFTGHAYVTKLSADGSAFLYTAVLAGTNRDFAAAIAIDAAGNAVLAGNTSSPDFPVTAGVVQPLLAGPQNAFVAKLDPSGHIVFSTYLGGTGSDSASHVQLDSQGNIYVAGLANSLDFPTTAGSFQPSPFVASWAFSPGGFITKLKPDGSALAFSSYVPGYGNDLLAVSPSGETWLAGSMGAGFPVTASAPRPCFGAGSDISVAHLDAAGALLDATYLGLSGETQGVYGVAVTADESLLLTWHLAGAGMDVSQVRFGGAGWSAPACLSPDVLNSAALHSSGYVAAGEFITLTGAGIGPAAGVSYQPGPGGQVPLELSGVKVFFDGQQAPLLYVQSRQVNVLVPWEVNERPSTAINLEYNGVVFGPLTVALRFADPAVFRLGPGSAQALAVNQDGTLNGPSSPASPGSVVSVWGTGFGGDTPPCTTGGLNPSAAASLNSSYSLLLYPALQIPIGSVPTAAIEYVGTAPTLLCGIGQINFYVPLYAPHGPLSVNLSEQTLLGSSISDVAGFSFVIAVK